MDSIQALILALIQGITEFLPISSSAHLILPSQVLGWEDQGLAFDVAVHLGSLLAVLAYFHRSILAMVLGAFEGLRRWQWNADLRLGLQIVLATLPAVLAGLLLKDLVETSLRSVTVIATTTILFGVLLGAADQRAGQPDEDERKDEYGLSWLGALLIGLAQAIAIVPGTSRSGITMTAALFLGLSRAGASRFSFLLAIPTILGAGTLLTKDLVESPTPVAWDMLILGTAASGVAAYLCIALFLRWIERIGMMPFVIYRLLLGLTLIWVIAG